MPTVKEIQNEQNMDKQKALILAVEELTPELKQLFQSYIERADAADLAAAASVRKLIELDPDVDLAALAKTLGPLAKGKPLVQSPLVRQLLQSSNKEGSRDLLLLLMEDYWIAQSVVREMRDYGRDDQELINKAVDLLPAIQKVDRPAASEMKYWLKSLGVKLKAEKKKKPVKKPAPVKKTKAEKKPVVKDPKKEQKKAAKALQEHIRNGLSQAGPVDRGQHYPYEKLVQEYRDMDPDKRPEFARMVAECVTDSDVFVRSSAIRFFQMERSANDAGNLATAFVSHMELFEDVEDPIMGATNDLLGELLRSLVNQQSRFAGNPILLMALRQMTVTERAGTIVAGMLYADRAWMLEHAKEVLKADPKTLENYVLNLLVQEELVADGAFERLLQDAVQVLGKEQVEAVLRERLSGKPELLERGLDVLDDET